jgi:nitroreductase
MTECILLAPGQRWDDGAPLPAAQVAALVATAARAPSLHNTQPWRFRVARDALELFADPARSLPVLDPAGRQLVMSCGAALFGLRLAVRQLGHVPVLSLLPDHAQPGLLARVYLGARLPITGREWRMLAAVPHRHTHRGPFSAEPLPDGLLAGLQHDAVAEGAELVLVRRGTGYQRLAALVSGAGRAQDRDPLVRAEIQRWTRPPASEARDGVPASAYPAHTGHAGEWPPGRLPARDFDLGRGQGTSRTGGAPPAATAILATAADTPADWLRAGQALQRVLTHAASQWVFASLSSQALESESARAALARQLKLTGAPQIVLQFGRAHAAEATARRPADEVLDAS